MKKLLFATALVASAAAFATNGTALNAISFEGHTADTGVGSGSGDIPEVGGATGTPYFWYEGEANGDGSLVKAFGSGDVLAPAITRPYFFQGETAGKYLELSTEGGTLWRSINESSASGLGTAQAIAADGTYLDTLVQFTPTEDGGAPELTQDDKLAIWLNVDANGVTNLMVKASFVEDSGGVVCTPSNYVVSCGKNIVAGQWYRLTVQVVPDVSKSASDDPDNAIMGFFIFVDGDPVIASSATFDSTYIATATDDDWGWITDETTVPLLQSGKVFPSLKGMSATATLQGVGFKGSGALDDIVWTTEYPFQGGSSAGWIDEVVTVFDRANLDTTEKAKITAWATANNITVASGSEEIAAAAYLLNLTSLPAAIPDLTITSIEEGQDANDTPVWILTVAASVNDTALSIPTTINGAVMLKQAATLAGLASANASTATFAIAEGTATVTVAKDAAAAKFMKVGVGIAPPANAQQGQQGQE